MCVCVCVCEREREREREREMGGETSGYEHDLMTDLKNRRASDRRAMVTVVGNGHSTSSSNPGRGYLYFHRVNIIVK